MKRVAAIYARDVSLDSVPCSSSAVVELVHCSEVSSVHGFKIWLVGLGSDDSVRGNG